MSVLSHLNVDIELDEFRKGIDIQGEVFLSKKTYYVYRAKDFLSGNIVMSGSLPDNINDRLQAFNWIYRNFPNTKGLTFVESWQKKQYMNRVRPAKRIGEK